MPDMSKVPSIRQEATDRAFEAHHVFTHIRGELEQGKLNPFDALEQMMNEFTRSEKVYWNKKFRERRRSVVDECSKF